MQYNITYRQKDKGWQFIISYKLNKKWKQKSKQGFKSKSLAKIAAQEEVKVLEENIEYIETDYSEITFKDFSEIYLSHSSLHHAPNTIVAVNSSLSAFSTLNNKKVKDITLLDLQICIDNLIEKNLKASSIKYYLSDIKKILNSASHQYKIMKPIDFYLLRINSKKESTEKRVLTLDELKLLIDKIKSEKPQLIISIAGMCGLRYGEIVGLTWDCVDLKNSIITVNKQWKKLKNGYGFGELKSSHSYRQVPIPTKLNIMLKKYKYNTPLDINNRLFPYATSVTSNLNYYIKRYGYDITMHELRHTYATNLISNGIDFKTAAKLLGHNIEQTMRTYSHVNDDMLKNATKVIEKLF